MIDAIAIAFRWLQLQTERKNERTFSSRVPFIRLRHSGEMVKNGSLSLHVRCSSSGVLWPIAMQMKIDKFDFLASLWPMQLSQFLVRLRMHFGTNLNMKRNHQANTSNRNHLFSPSPLPAVQLLYFRSRRTNLSRCVSTNIALFLWNQLESKKGNANGRIGRN